MYNFLTLCLPGCSADSWAVSGSTLVLFSEEIRCPHPTHKHSKYDLFIAPPWPTSPKPNQDFIMPQYNSHTNLVQICLLGHGIILHKRCQPQRDLHQKQYVGGGGEGNIIPLDEKGRNFRMRDFTQSFCYLRILHLLLIILSLGCKVFYFSESQDAMVIQNCHEK